MFKALSAVQDVLRCPHCSEPIKIEDGSAKCAAGHSFDIARQGYVNFLTKQTFIKNADTAAMVDARQKMHPRPFFRDLAQQIAQIYCSLGTKVDTVAVRTGCPIAMNRPRIAALMVAE